MNLKIYVIKDLTIFIEFEILMIKINFKNNKY